MKNLPARLHPWCTLSVLIGLSCAAPAPGPEAESTADWASRIENVLVRSVLLAGDAPPEWTLAERMEHYNVPGVSVAIIEDGAVVWSHAWGTADTETGAPVTTEARVKKARIMGS